MIEVGIEICDYNTNAIVKYEEKLGVKIIILSKTDQKSKRNFDSNLYRLRHIVENIFLKFKSWRGIATRYFKTSVAFRAFFRIYSIYLAFFYLIFLLSHLLSFFPDILS